MAKQEDKGKSFFSLFSLNINFYGRRGEKKDKEYEAERYETNGRFINAYTAYEEALEAHGMSVNDDAMKAGERDGNTIRLCHSMRNHLCHNQKDMTQDELISFLEERTEQFNKVPLPKSKKQACVRADGFENLADLAGKDYVLDSGYAISYSASLAEAESKMRKYGTDYIVVRTPQDSYIARSRKGAEQAAAAGQKMGSIPKTEAIPIRYVRDDEIPGLKEKPGTVTVCTSNGKKDGMPKCVVIWPKKTA